MTSTINGWARYAACLLALLFASSTIAQESRIASEIAEYGSVFQSVPAVQPLVLINDRNDQTTLANQEVDEAVFYSADMHFLQTIISSAAELLLMELPAEGNTTLTLKLKRADVLTDSFKVTTATGGDVPFPYSRGAYYWGIVDGYPSSLVAIAFSQDEIMGFMQIGDQHYSLGKLQDGSSIHILYKTDNLKSAPGISCFTDDDHVIGKHDPHATSGNRDANNCVRMYIQVDYDMFVAKGGVQQATDYVNGAFSQVAILYNNEDIFLTVNEIFVWNTVDPFTGPTTSNYLTQFRNYLNGSFNGDLAHLVGTQGGGGVAYVDVLCNGFYSCAYSAVNLTYANVPNYSWTVMVLTHEIGHNIASPHTHACAWNGNNTAIDGCGPAAGYSEGCTGPIPSAGTIMSYCHLVNSIDFNLGFGQQPGDLIRSSVYNAACLTSCGPPIQFDAGITAIAKPIAFPCEDVTAPEVTLKNFGATTLTSVTIQYQLDNGTVLNHNWTGSLAQNATTIVILPNVTYGTGPHLFEVNTLNPNGQADQNAANDAASKSFIYHINWCVCTAATASLAPNPLTHTGSGSSAANVNLGAGSKRPQFTISNLNSKTNGSQSSRFIDQVNVSYLDVYGVTHNYGTFYGNQQSTVNVNIQDMVNTITITLTNGLGNNGYSGTLSISFSTINYCGPEGGCPDDDGDGVCNAVDVCPGFDDGLIGDPCDDGNACTNNDVYTINCLCEGTVIPACGCTTETDNFSPNPLTHVGAGSSSSVATLDAGNSDAEFTISNLGARTSGNPAGRYIEQVTVRYVNSNNQEITYGVFRGDEVSTVNVIISGVVQSVTLILQDVYDGNSSTQLSVNMTVVTSCAGGALVNITPDDAFDIYPNPVTNDLFIRWNTVPEKAEIRIFNAVGLEITSMTVENSAVARISMSSLGIGGQLLFIVVQADGIKYNIRRVLYN